MEKDAESTGAGRYQAVPFAYGNTADSADQKSMEMEMKNTCFYPPFPVPERLLQNLPPTEKIHQIIARTALFVSQHGGQSEIVLRVKQGDNPTFGFLMPDNKLHPYFRYLVDNQDFLKADSDGKAMEEKGYKEQAGNVANGGALSLLGSVYGSGDDEEAVANGAGGSNMDAADTSTTAEVTKSSPSEPAKTSESIRRDITIPKHSHFFKEKAAMSVKNGTSTAVKAKGASSTENKQSLGSSIWTAGKSKDPNASSTYKAEPLFIEPPSELKRLIAQIVEIILKKGKEFEEVLIEQDKQHERFPFLVPTNPYHPYYLKALKKGQKSKSNGRRCGPERSASLKEVDSISISAEDDFIPEYDRKERFKMVIGKSKMEIEDEPLKAANEQCGVGLDAAAAILQAATRGIKKSNLGFLSNRSVNGTSDGPSWEGGGTSSFGSQGASRPQGSNQKENKGGQPSVAVPVAKEIARSAALAAANEADSSEAGLSRAQKLKAERLKRAKMFTALLKRGAAPLVKDPQDPLRGLSVEPAGSGISACGTDVLNQDGKEKEGSSVPADVGTAYKPETSEKMSSDDEIEEKTSRKRRHYRARRPEEHGEDEEEEEEAGDDKDKGDRRHSRKKHRSHHSSRHHRDRSKDRHKHRRRHSSSKRESRHKREHDDTSEEDERHHRHKYDHASADKRRHRKHEHENSYDNDRRHTKHKHDVSSEEEGRQTKHKHNESSRDDRRHKKHRHDDSIEEGHSYRKHEHSRSPKAEGRHEKKSRKHRKRSNSEDAELEEGEIRTKSSDKSQSSLGDGAGVEVSVDKLNACQKESTPQPPAGTTEVSDDLRAKIRAMLLATL